MSEIKKLNLDITDSAESSDSPPWEESGGLDFGAAGGDSALERYAGGGIQDTAEAHEKTLEIYKKADNFKRLSLLSGNNVGDIDKYVAEHYGSEGTTRLALVRHVMSCLGYVPSQDVLLTLSCTKKARAIIATAGAGKTTSLQLDLCVSKMLDQVLHCYHLDPVPVEGTGVSLPAILYLNYNKHNVQPIYDKHQSMCARINATIVENIDDAIESSTVHAFCHKWLTAFSIRVEIPELRIATDEERSKLWTAVISPRWKKFYGDADVGVEWQALDELYTYKVESMLEWDQFFECAKFVDSGLKSEFVKSCIKKYDGLKSSMGLMDFTDYLVLMIRILREHDDLRHELQERYKIIVADENQDFTALMNELLLMLYDPEINRLIVVGDSDQTIYEFKGVSPDNIVRLVDRLDDVELLGLDTNYRCPDGIVEAAKSILSMNIMRFEKPILTVRTGGRIVKHPLKARTMQPQEVLRIIEGNGRCNYGKTVVTYRNNSSALVVGEELYYAGIPFSVLDDRRPFNNLVFKHIQSALQALKECDNMERNKCLYRFLPVTKELWYRILEANAKHRKQHLHDIIIPDGVPQGTTQAISILVGISLRIESSPCSDYIGALIHLYRKYYFDFMLRNPNPSIGDEDYYALLLERSVKFWSRAYTYDYLITELRERNVDCKDAVTLSTFHGLKGLEFDYVIAIDFIDSIFPNFIGIEQRYPENTALEAKEAENRLCYVLVTRTIKELHLLYTDNDPSVYVDVLCPKSVETAHEAAVPQLGLGGFSAPSDTNEGKLSFIQRLTRDRRL